MTASRLGAGFLAGACLNAAASLGKPAVALRRGDPDAGVIFVKVLSRSGEAVLFGQAIDTDGESAWRQIAGPAAEADIDARIDREARIDRDLWALEILDDALEHPLKPKLTDGGL